MPDRFDLHEWPDLDDHGRLELLRDESEGMSRRVAKWQRREARRVQLVSVAVVASLVALLLVAMLGIVVLHRVKVNERRQVTNRAQALQQDFELCGASQRTQVYLAVQLRYRFRIEAAVRDLQRDFPIPNCLPTLRGARAVPLPIEEQDRFISYFRRTGMIPAVTRDNRVLEQNDPRAAENPLPPP